MDNSQPPSTENSPADQPETIVAAAPSVQPAPVVTSLEDYSGSRDQYDEFEIGEHKVPWFLWIFFTGIVLWASVSWIQFFGY